MKERIKHALALCGPGVEQQKKNGQDDYDLINISRAGAGLGIPAHLERPQAAHIGKSIIDQLTIISRSKISF